MEATPASSVGFRPAEQRPHSDEPPTVPTYPPAAVTAPPPALSSSLALGARVSGSRNDDVRNSPHTAPAAPYYSPSNTSPKSSITTKDLRQDRHHSRPTSELRIHSAWESERGRRSVQDWEKAAAGTDASSPYGTGTRTANIVTVPYVPEDTEDDSLESRALYILLYLSGPCFLVSLLILIWTLLSAFLALLLGPLRSCRLGTQLDRLLGPPLRLQLHLIVSSAPSHAHSAGYNTSMMLAIHATAPLTAAGVALAAWTAAGFWFYVAILGNPDGKDRSNDGRATVFAVRAWWERWLLRGFNERQLPMVERRRSSY